SMRLPSKVMSFSAEASNGCGSAAGGGAAGAAVAAPVPRAGTVSAEAARATDRASGVHEIVTISPLSAPVPPDITPRPDARVLGTAPHVTVITPAGQSPVGLQLDDVAGAHQSVGALVLGQQVRLDTGAICPRRDVRDPQPAH